MIRILDPESGANADVAVPPHIVAAFRKQLELDAASNPGEGFRERMCRCLTEAIVQGLSYELKPPTEKQVAYAAAIAHRLGVPLPPEALQLRDAMCTFIDAHKEKYLRIAGRAPSS